MLEQVMAACNNYFEIFCDAVADEFEITGGVLDFNSLKTGQYYRIKGSVFNDGVHQHPAVDLQDETFIGTIYPMAVPGAFIDMCSEIEAWESKHAKGVFESENLGANQYSYKLALNADGTAQTWENVFAKKLRRWRKL